MLLSKSFLFSVFILILGTAFWFFGARSNLQEMAEPIGKTFEEVKTGVFLPPPLRAEKSRFAAPEIILTSAGVIGQTNLERKNNGLAALKEDQKLNQAAAFKLADMFQNQFFAHESPSGEGAADLVREATYEFVSVGENLALGNFESDEVLVGAWMDSPGHRANILGKSFSELGVAVGKGKFEGQEIWLAVQIFAKPLSACLQPDQNLKTGIESSEKQIEELAASLSQLRAQIEGFQPKTRREVAEHNQLVEEHNALVAQINSLIEAAKILMNTYNSQVRALNECIAG